MEILKFILMGFAVLIGLILIIPIFTKKNFSVQRLVVVEKPISEVFDFVKLLKNQDYFSVWATKDPDMKKSFQGEDGTLGAISSWDSQLKDVGMGEQEIMKISDGNGLTTSFDFSNRLKRQILQILPLRRFPKQKPMLNGVFQEKCNIP